MGWSKITAAHPNHRKQAECGPYALLDNHIQAPYSALIFDARTGQIVWEGPGNFHNAALLEGRGGEIGIYPTSNVPAERIPVFTGLYKETVV
jgi:hypothetical protein